jgi:hypothetical protein
MTTILKLIKHNKNKNAKKADTKYSPGDKFPDSLWKRLYVSKVANPKTRSIIQPYKSTSTLTLLYLNNLLFITP